MTEFGKDSHSIFSGIVSLNAELNPFQSPNGSSTDGPDVKNQDVENSPVFDPRVRDPSGLIWLFVGLGSFVVCVYFMLIEFPEICAYVEERRYFFPSRLRTVLKVNSFIFDHSLLFFLPAILVVLINEMCVRGAWKRKVRRVMGIGVFAISCLFAVWVVSAIVSEMI